MTFFSFSFSRLNSEWLPLSEYSAKSQKEIEFCHLPNSAKLYIAETLMKKQKGGQSVEEPRIQVKNNDDEDFSQLRPNRKSYNHNLSAQQKYPLPPKGLF